MNQANITIVGIGRMGKGMALAFAYAGYKVHLLDSEEHSTDEFTAIIQLALDELQAELDFLQNISVIDETRSAAIAERIQILSKDEAEPVLAAADFVFEAVAEQLEVKEVVYTWLNTCVSDKAVVSSTTSTMSANDLCKFIDNERRFINAHWLNPAHLMPLIEVSPADGTAAATIGDMQALLQSIGKVPVVCKSTPGFILSRIQAVALNEAARIVEDGVASAEDVDKAIKTGFGIRYATLGLLEFIDWGGGDILYHGSTYLSEKLDKQRFAVPDIVKKNMAEQRNGLRDGLGFYDWQGIDVNAYRQQKMTDFVRLLEHRKLMPKQADKKT